jgi:MFS family permease
MTFNKPFLYFYNFLREGWQISLLALLPFLQRELNLSLIEVGALSMVAGFAAVISSLYAGHINHWLGSKVVILLSAVCYAVAWSVFLLPHSVSMTYLVFVVGGLGDGIFGPIAQAIVVRTAVANRRAQVLGEFLASGDIGRIAMIGLTPLMVSWLSLNLTAVIYLSLVILTFIFFMFTVVNTPQVEIKADATVSRQPLTFKKLFQSKSYLLVWITGVMDGFASSSLFIFIPFLLIPKGIDIAATGLFTALLFLGYLFGRVIITRIADRFGGEKVFILSQLGMAVLITSLVLLNNYWLIMLNLLLLGMVTRGTSPVVKSLMANKLEDYQLEKGYSLLSSSTQTAITLSRPTFSFVGTLLGISGVFYASGLVALLTIVPASLLLKSQSRK